MSELIHKQHNVTVWGIRKRTDLSLVEIAKWINLIINGWINYYGRSVVQSCTEFSAK
ncbi:group II intron maturase-specific domain-containing protein [Rheinheimera soli]|uniref:group II intron maturase-specific domain-containing protein n=1 Tax=Rheinheimera soli TaxID=443616 RepID=UPI0038621BFE